MVLCAAGWVCLKPPSQRQAGFFEQGSNAPFPEGSLRFYFARSATIQERITITENTLKMI
jgi:hypothetical protein